MVGREIARHQTRHLVTAWKLQTARLAIQRLQILQKLADTAATCLKTHFLNWHHHVTWVASAETTVADMKAVLKRKVRQFSLGLVHGQSFRVKDYSDHKTSRRARIETHSLISMASSWLTVTMILSGTVIHSVLFVLMFLDLLCQVISCI